MVFVKNLILPLKFPFNLTNLLLNCTSVFRLFAKKKKKMPKKEKRKSTSVLRFSFYLQSKIILVFHFR